MEAFQNVKKKYLQDKSKSKKGLEIVRTIFYFANRIQSLREKIFFFWIDAKNII